MIHRSISLGAALLIVATHVYAQANNPVLYESDGLTIERDITIDKNLYCRIEQKGVQPRQVRVSAKYKMDHQERGELFKPNLAEFLLKNITPVIRSLCEGMEGFRENYTIELLMQKTSDNVSWDRFEFRYRAGMVRGISYTPSMQAQAVMTEAQIAVLTPPRSLSRVDRVLGEAGPFRVYPTDDPTCTPYTIAEVDVVYDIPSEQRDDWISSHYNNGNNNEKKNAFERFATEVLVPALEGECQRYGSIRARFYESGSIAFWDDLSFDVTWDGLKIASRVMSEQAKLSAALKKNAELLGTCDSSVFCQLLGGRYLDAIYRNDQATIQSITIQLEQEYDTKGGGNALRQFVQIAESFGAEGADTNSVGVHAPLLVIGKYLYDYSRFASTPGGRGVEACFRTGARTVDTRATTRVINYEDQYGNNQGTAGGIRVGARYKVNPEFLEVCDQSQAVCGAGSGEFGDLLTGFMDMPKTASVIAGVGQLVNTLDCRSPEVLQFERNLISLTESALRRDAASALNTGSVSAERTAQETKRLFMEAMEEREAENQTPQVQTARPPRTRTRAGTQQDQTNASRQGETPRMARLAEQPALDERVLYDLGSNLKAGEDFLRANKHKDGVVETGSGLQYRIIKSGSGTNPTSNNQVTAHMRGTLINGYVFSDTYAKGQALNLSVGQVIKGMGEGLQQVKEGGKIQLFIPPSLAYGNQAAGSLIPAGATLIYEIELIKIN